MAITVTSCGISSGLGLTCDTLKEAAGGLKQRVYIGNLLELDSYTTDGDGFLTALTFDTYKGLHKFIGSAFGNSYVSDITRAEGGKGVVFRVKELFHPFP